jgi:signal transduction histidine kinase/DNA-binding response OmpR family regulator/ligand-binding sensor domain-containing protein
MLKRLLILLIALAPAILFAAQALIERHFGAPEGMPVSSATSAQMDADGFLWFATHDGLARFDGRGFSVFDNARFPGMGSNRVLRLYAGLKGTVYGVGILGEWLEIDSRSIQRLRLDPANPEAKVTFITRQHPAANATAGLLCLSLSVGMYCESKVAQSPLDKADITHQAQSPLPATAFYLRRKFNASMPVLAALPAGENDWLVVPGQGIYYASSAGTALVWPDPQLKFLNSLDINAYVGFDGALIIDLATGVLRLQQDGRTRWIDADPQEQSDVLQLLPARDGSVQINSSQESYQIDVTGLRTQIHAKSASEEYLRSWAVPSQLGAVVHSGSRWHSRGGRLYRDDVAVLVSRGEIRDVLFADSGVIWASTNRDGVYALSPARVQTIRDPVLAGSNVYGTSIAADGSVWLGSLGAGVFRIGADDRVQRFSEADGLPGPNVWGIAVAPNQAVFGFAINSGLWQLRPGTARFEPQRLPADLDSASLASMSFDAQEKLWVAGGAGAWKWAQPELGADGWRKIWPEPGPEPGFEAGLVPGLEPGLESGRPELAAVRVITVLHDADGRSWYGTDQGLFWQQGQQSVRIEPLAGTVIRGLFRARDGALWVASEGKGLSRLPMADLSGLALLRIGRAQGMPSNSPHAIVQDQMRNLWINSNQGIYRLTPNEVEALRSGAVQALSPLTLGLADGLIELEGNGGVQPAAAIGADGQIWFPTQRGVVRFHPQLLGAAREPGRVIIEAVMALGRPLDRPLDRNGTALRNELQLPLGVREISIQYNAAELNAGQVRFRYRLLGAGELAEAKAWVEANSRTLASFDVLTPGRYRFEVQAGNTDGIWKQDSALLAFQVPARFYETRAFQWSIAVALLIFSGFAMRLRLRTLNQRARRLERVVQDRTEELSLEKSKVEQTLAALSESHLGIESRNQRLAEQATRLEALDRFRSRLLADVSHELRSPLMLVNLPLQELSARALAEPEQRLVDMASLNTGRLSHLVEQLVSLVQAEAQQIRLSLRRINLTELTARVIAGFAPISLQTGVRFVLRDTPSEPLPLVYADAEHITTVLSNFLDNASKYAQAQSEVSVSVQFLAATDCLRVAVQDHGPGFPAELASTLFERFFRADGPPRAGREGLGVGLALAQELIFLHGGRIGAINGRADWLDLVPASNAASGACFWFELPLGSAHVALDDLVIETAIEVQGATETIVNRAEGSASLLLVEDHPELAAYLAERLAEYCPVIVAANAEHAWQQLHQNTISIVVSDVVLPGHSGIELCKRIKTNPELAGTPVLLISAKAGKADLQSGLDAGAFDWLTKPFSLDTLLSRVQNAWPEFASLVRQTDTTELDPATLAPTPAEENGQTSTQRLDRILDIALSQLSHSTFGVPEWSERAHLSERQLRRRVTELTGMAPVAWLREQRLLNVRALITSAACSTLAEAGTRAGIDNAGYLYRLYRARFGSD